MTESRWAPVTGCERWATRSSTSRCHSRHEVSPAQRGSRLILRPVSAMAAPIPLAPESRRAAESDLRENGLVADSECGGPYALRPPAQACLGSGREPDQRGQ